MRQRSDSAIADCLACAFGASRETLADVVAALGGELPDPRPPIKSDAPIGEGSMGAVTRVRDRALERDLAMKKIRADLAARLAQPDQTKRRLQVVRRFVNEARITAGLDHPGVVPVHEFGLDEAGQLYFTMKLVKGDSLRGVFRQFREGAGDWTLPRLVQVMARVCDTLAFAHAHGVIHRDLKPANIMVGEFGEVYVMDWGLARRIGDSEYLDTGDRLDPLQALVGQGEAASTQFGVVIGSPPFMAPEQARGEIDELGPRSDVYSVGAMLYDLLTGAPPHTDEAKTAREVITRAASGPPSPLAGYAPDTPDELVAIIEKAMAFEATDRYPSAVELREDLLNFVDGRAVQAYRTGPLVELTKWVKRNRHVAAALAGTSLLALMATVGFAITENRRAAESERAADLERDARKAQRRAADRARTAEKRSNGLRLCAVAETLLEKDPALALQAAVQGARDAPGFEANSALYSALSRLREERSLRTTGYVGMARHSADGTKALTVNAKGDPLSDRWFGRAVVWDVATGDALANLGGEKTSHYWAEFDPSGARVVSARVGAPPALWDAATGELIAELDDPTERVVRVAFARSGDRVATWGDDGWLRVHDLTDLERPPAVCDVGRPVRGAVFTPDGRHIVCAAESGVGYVFNAGSGELLRELLPTVPDQGFRSIGTSSDGSRIAIETANLDVFDLASGDVLWSASTIIGCAVARDVPLIAYFAHDGQELRVADLEDGNVRERARAWMPTHTSISADGKTVAWVHNARFWATVWRPFAHSEPSRLVGHRYYVRDVDVSPSGDRVLSGSADSTARLWSVGAAVDVMEGPRHGRYQQVTRDGRLATLRINEPPGGVELFDAETHQVRARFPIPALNSHSYSFDREGRWLATSSDGMFRLWDTADASLIGEASCHRLGYVTVGPNRRRAVVNHDGPTCQLIDFENPDSTVVLGPTYDRTFEVAFSASGSLVAVTAGPSALVHIYSAETGEELRVLKGHTGFALDVAFAPSGDRVATTAVDSSVRVWDAATGEQLAECRGLPMTENYVGWSPDGTLLCIFNSPDTFVIDAETGEQIAVMPGHRGEAWFSEDGKSLMTREYDLTQRWPLDALAFAESRAPRELDADERTRLRLDK